MRGEVKGNECEKIGKENVQLKNRMRKMQSKAWEKSRRKRSKETSNSSFHSYKKHVECMHICTLAAYSK